MVKDIALGLYISASKSMAHIGNMTENVLQKNKGEIKQFSCIFHKQRILK